MKTLLMRLKTQKTMLIILMKKLISLKVHNKQLSQIVRTHAINSLLRSSVKKTYSKCSKSF